MKITNKQKILKRAYNLYEDKGQWLFSYKGNLSDIPYGSFRNNMSELHKEGRTKTMGYGQYALTDCIPSKEYKDQLMNQIQLQNNTGEILEGKTVTNTVTLSFTNDNCSSIHLNTPNAITTCLQSALWDEDNNIHNLNLTTSIPELFKYLKSEGHTVDRSNDSIRIIDKRINNLSIKAFVYNTDTIEIFISNSNNPIMINVQDIKRLRNTLEQFRIHLGQYNRNVPELNTSFKVVKFDYAHDGILPIPVSFTYNYYNLEDELIQIYSKRSNSFYTEIRFESRNINPNELFFGEYERQLLSGNTLRQYQQSPSSLQTTNLKHSTITMS
jgi:hypothetical protein